MTSVTVTKYIISNVFTVERKSIKELKTDGQRSFVFRDKNQMIDHRHAL